MPTDRANRWSLLSFLLRRFLQKLTFQTAGLLQNLFFQMAQTLVRSSNALVQARRQTLLPVGHRTGKRLETAVGLRNRFNTAVAHAPVLSLIRKSYPCIFGYAPLRMGRKSIS